jgi:hypothetical protein
VIDCHTAALDEATVEIAAKETGAIVVAEEHLIRGGLGSAVAQVVVRRQPVPMEFVGLQDTFAESGRPRSCSAPRATVEIFARSSACRAKARVAVMRESAMRHPVPTPACAPMG